MRHLRSLRRLISVATGWDSLRRRRRSHGRLEQLEPRQLLAAVLSADISNVANNNTAVQSLIEFDGALYFFANDYEHGAELWRTDGTVVGTERVSDIGPAGLDGVLTTLYIVHGWASHADGPPASVAGGLLYFVGNNWQDGWELWAYDGTSQPYMVRDIHPDSMTTAITSPSQFTPSSGRNGLLYFTADDGIHGRELWCTNGRPGNTFRLTDIMPGAASSNVQIIGERNGEIYFSAGGGGANDLQLWKSDGTQAGTTLVAVLPVGPQNPGFHFAKYTAQMNGDLYFVASSGVTGQELWRIDSSDQLWPLETIAGPVGSTITRLTVVGRMIYFLSDSDLWQTDGTSTSFVCSAGLSPRNLTAFNGSLLLTNDIVGSSPIYMLDPTIGGLVPFGGNQQAFLMADDLIVLDNQLYFSARNPAFVSWNDQSEIWVTDGTSAGSVRLGQFESVPWTMDSRSFPSFRSNRPTKFNGTLYFASRTVQTANTPLLTTPRSVNLYSSTGLAGGTSVLLDLSAAANLPSRPMNLIASSDSLYFTADDSIHGRQLYRADGTSGTAGLVGNLSGNYQMATLNATLFYIFNDGISGTELWTTDSSSNPQMLIDINPGPGGSSITELVPHLGEMYFVGYPQYSATAWIWKSDGTTAGTQMVSGFVDYGGFLTSHSDGWLYFVTGNATGGTDLWRTDGTTTQSVTTLSSLPVSQSIMQIASSGRSLYLLVNDGTGNGFELWQSDGSQAGTFAIFSPGNSYGAGFNNFELTTFGTSVAFVANGSVFVSDGTAAGTYSVLPLRRNLGGFFSEWPVEMTAVDGRLFVAANGIISPVDSGHQIWMYDGATLQQRTTFPVGASAHSPLTLHSLTAVSGELYFGLSGLSDVELYTGTFSYLQGIWSLDTAAGQPVQIEHASVERLGYQGGPYLWTTEGPSFAPVQDKLFFASGIHENRHMLDWQSSAWGVSTDVRGELFYVPVSRPPQALTLSSAAVTENQPTGTLVSVLTTNSSRTYSYALVPGQGATDNADFYIQGSDLRTSRMLDYEVGATRSVRIRSTDVSTGLYIENSFIISVANLNEIVSIDVQLGQTQRSYVRYLDVNFESSQGISNMINSGSIRLTEMGLNGLGTTPKQLTAAQFTIYGSMVRIDFGVNGIGGNRSSRAGDGYYEINVDSDRNGILDSRKYFHRLFCDVNGDGRVDLLDQLQVQNAVAAGSLDPESDCNGAGGAQSNDLTWVRSFQGRRLLGRPRNLLDD